MNENRKGASPPPSHLEEEFQVGRPKGPVGLCPDRVRWPAVLRLPAATMRGPEAAGFFWLPAGISVSYRARKPRWEAHR